MGDNLTLLYDTTEILDAIKDVYTPAPEPIPLPVPSVPKNYAGRLFLDEDES
jgi:hypothetical protein